MRQKRAKAYRKLMALYCMSFGFREPYQVLVDALMCKEATAQKIELVKQLGNVLQGTVKPMITQCCIHELYLQGPSVQPTVDLAKTFERRKCNHKEAIPGEECLASVVGETNKHRYVIASQSQGLRQKLRLIAGVPIVHINRAVMVLEPPSDVTVSAKASAEEEKLHPSAPEVNALAGPGPGKGGEDEGTEKRKKRKGPKGPNPLSVKKKAVKVQEGRRKPEREREMKEEESRVEAGVKRKRDVEGEADGVALVRHKRRRRRKGGPSPPNSPGVDHRE